MKYAVLNINEVSDDEFRKFYSLMPDKRQKKCSRLSNEIDRKLCIGAYMLLCSLTGEENFEFLYTETGKPYIKDNPFYFSLSHSGNYAAAAVSDFPVGIDIETVGEIKDSVIKRVCSDEERAYINKTSRDSFYKIWTYKEAYLKMTGDGIGAGLKTIDYTKRDENVISVTEHGYAMCVITESKI